MRRNKQQIESLGYRLANLETVVGEPGAQDAFGNYVPTGMRGSIAALWRAIERRDTPPPKPKIEKRITFTGDDHPAINYRIIQWLADPGVEPARAIGEHCAITFTASTHAELRQAVLTYAQEHRL